jgi:hypothetical protein
MNFPSQLALQLRKNGSELVVCGRLLWPLDDEALLIRGGWLRDNVEVDVVHKLIVAMQRKPSSWSATSVEAILLSVVLHPHLMRDASIILSEKRRSLDRE